MTQKPGTLSHCMVIAEAATNHGGDMDLAKQMIDVAAHAGADFIKFQSWRTATMDPANPAYAAMARKELSDTQHFELIEHCQSRGIGFLTTCFDIGRVEFLSTLGLEVVKVASTDVTSTAMLKKLREAFPTILLSTGMSHPHEVAAAADVIKSGNFYLLHCVSLYPTPLEKANLSRMLWLRQFTDNVGYSDHTLGTEAAKIAISMGARVVEKHFTLSTEQGNVFSEMAAAPEDIEEICKWATTAVNCYGNEDPEMDPEEQQARDQFIGRWGDNR